MHNFVSRDVVKTIYEKKEVYLIVDRIEGKKAYCYSPDILNEIEVPVAKLEYIPPVKFSKKQLIEFCRAENLHEEIVMNRTFLNVESTAKYQITLEDVYVALKNLAKIQDEGKSLFYWLEEIYGNIGDLVNIDNCLTGYIDTEDGLPTEAMALAHVFDELQTIEYSGYYDGVDGVIKYIDTFYANQKKPLLKRILSDSEQTGFITYWDSYGTIADQSKDIQKLWVKAVEEQCEKKNPQALEIKAYACYGNGNGVYKQDYEACKNCLLELMKIDPSPFAANTLGYIYYYGRCKQGKPEYAKAFKYYSIAASAGVAEAHYKLADMFYNGYGVEKNLDTASRLVWNQYYESLHQFCAGNYGGSFADVALRAGWLTQEGINCYPDEMDAYGLYLQARYALKKRMEDAEFFGNPIIMNHIEDAIVNLLDDMGEEEIHEKTVVYETVAPLLVGHDYNESLVEMKIKDLKGDQKKLTFTVKDNDLLKTKPQFLVTVPEASYCELKDKIEVTVKNMTELNVPADSDTVVFNKVLGSDFYLNGDKVASIEGQYVYKVK